jgi:hypothetical protein
VTELPLTWITANWRLKLLSVLLATGLVAAVAFSENPPEAVNVPVKVEYHLPQSGNLVLISPPPEINVPVVGLRDAVSQYRDSASGVVVDLSHASPGPDQTFFAHPQVTTAGVTPQSTSIQLMLTIEELKTVRLDIDVRTPNLAPGIEITSPRAVCGNDTVACQLIVTAPARLVDGLVAYVDYDTRITSAGSIRTPSQTVRFERQGHQVDLAGMDTLPKPSWAPSLVTARLDALGGTQDKTVPLTYRVVGSTPCGYQISSVDVAPSLTATIRGPSDQVSAITELPLDPPISVSGQGAGPIVATRTISTGSNLVRVDPGSVRITISLAGGFPCGTVPPPLPAAPAGH